MPGRKGGKKVTIKNLEVVKVIRDDDLILIKGGIPGPNGGLILLYQN